MKLILYLTKKCLYNWFINTDLNNFHILFTYFTVLILFLCWFFTVSNNLMPFFCEIDEITIWKLIIQVLYKKLPGGSSHLVLLLIHQKRLFWETWIANRQKLMPTVQTRKLEWASGIQGQENGCKNDFSSMAAKHPLD